MARRRVMFTFTQEQIKEPVIHNLGQQFNLVTNIRRATLSEEEGWVVLDLKGRAADIEQGIAWVISKGVRVNPADEDIAGR